MTYRIHPDTPFLDSIVREKGSGYLTRKYFDKDYNVLSSAPDELKREIALLRGEDPADYGVERDAGI